MSGLRDYQEQAADFAYANDRTLILAKVGAGKTAIALTVMRDMLKDGIVKRWLVVAPKRVCLDTWPTEARLWAKSLTLNVAVGAPGVRKSAIMRPSDVVVINYDSLQWLAEKFPNLHEYFDGVVFDELTRLKNPSGKRFKAFLSIVEHINIRIGMTGSFTSNGLEDVFGQVKIIDQSRLGRSKGAFLQRYFWSADPKMGDWIPRPGSLDKIMERIKPITFLLESKEYADTLPPLQVIEMKCQMDDRKPYDEMKKNFVLEFGATQISAINAGVVTQKLRQLASGFVYESVSRPNPSAPGKFIINKTPHWFSYHKFELLENLLDENQHENTLIFYQYQEELAELQRRYPKAQTLDDKNAVDRWNAGGIPLLLAHPDSAQYGLNLQHGGSAIVFMSLPRSLTNFEHAIGRLHRSGQKHAVRVYCLMAERTIDDLVLTALHDKRSISEIAIQSLKSF